MFGFIYGGLLIPIFLLTASYLFLPSLAVAADARQSVLIPRTSYENIIDIDSEAGAIRKTAHGFSFSRSWWRWDRLLTRYQDNGCKDKNALKILRAVFLGGILDRYRELERKGEADLFYIFYVSGDNHEELVKRGWKRDIHGGGGHGGWGSASRMRIYEALSEENMLTDTEKVLFRQIVIQSLDNKFIDFSDMERGANNRPFANDGGVAIALRLFPDMPRAEEIRAWLHRQWRELAEYGDTAEINFHPYGPIFLEGMIDLAEELGKFETERNFIYTLISRYRDQLHGSGVKGCPNAGANANRDLKAIAENPWDITAYEPKEVYMWYRIAKHFKDPTFLWAAEQALLGGKGPKAQVPAEYQKAYDECFRIFNQMGLQPKMPAGKSSIAYLSPLKHKIPERLYVHPGKDAGKPFTSYYIHDRNNEYMHCFDDAAGRLYEYVVDGTKLLHSSGKYNGIFIGQGAYDMLLVLNPNETFPISPPNSEIRWQNSGFHGSISNVWNTASGTLHMVPGCRTAPDSANWRFISKASDWRWQRTDDPVGGAAANVDGLWKLNNDIDLESVSIILHGALVDEEIQEPETVFIQNLRLGGPKGDVMLVKLDEIPHQLEAIVEEYSEGKFINERILQGSTLGDIVQITGKGRNGTKALCVKVEKGKRITITVEVPDLKFNADSDYTRISYDYKAISKAPYLRRQGWRYGKANWPMLVADMKLNSRSIVPMHQIRGGILVEDSLKAENAGDDSFGQFTYRNYFTAHSSWTRQTILTKEGFLIVRDEFLPGEDAYGYQVGPNWLLKAESELNNGRHDSENNWFDAPPYDHAWWQQDPKRLLVYFHHQAGQTYGQIQHETSPDISREFKTNSTFAKAIVRAGEPKIFLSILVPYDRSDKVDDIANLIETTIDSNGIATARIAGIRSTIRPNGNWIVDR